MTIPHVDIADGKVVVDYDGFKVGHLVRKGRGKVVWRISSFWEVAGETMAALIPTQRGKYTNASAPLSTRTKVDP